MGDKSKKKEQKVCGENNLEEEKKEKEVEEKKDARLEEYGQDVYKRQHQRRQEWRSFRFPMCLQTATTLYVQ